MKICNVMERFLVSLTPPSGIGNGQQGKEGPGETSIT